LHEDKEFKFNHFTGFILEEEIVASLWAFVLRDHPKCAKRLSTDLYVYFFMG
jgi:hypothetical protein